MAVVKYIYDEDAVLQETDGSGVTLTEYTRVPGGYGDLLSEFDGTAAKYYEADALGSTDALVDQSQSVVDRWRYRGFGASTQSSGTDSNAFTWVGKKGYLADAATGLYLLGSGTRYYDPQVAKFLSDDPIGYSGGDANLSRYVGNNPINLYDQSGTSIPWEKIIGQILNRDRARLIGVAGLVGLGISPCSRLAMEIVAALNDCAAITSYLQSVCQKMGAPKFAERERATKELVEFIRKMADLNDAVATPCPPVDDNTLKCIKKELYRIVEDNPFKEPEIVERVKKVIEEDLLPVIPGMHTLPRG